MPLTESAFAALVEAGCPQCPGKKLAIRSIVAQKLPLYEGELHGAPAWDYKGEDLVRGTWKIECDHCKAALFAATECPRCGAADGVARALAQVNAFAMPVACKECGGELLFVSAYVPALIHYEGKRAHRPRTHTERDDAGFHAFRVECKGCKRVAELRHPCPLCAHA